MKTMEWINKSQLPLVKGFYYCFIPEQKEYHKHIEEYYFNGTDFVDGDTLFFGKCGGRKITKYITHYMIISEPGYES